MKKKRMETTEKSKKKFNVPFHAVVIVHGKPATKKKGE